MDSKSTKWNIFEAVKKLDLSREGDVSNSVHQKRYDSDGERKRLVTPKSFEGEKKDFRGERGTNKSGLFEAAKSQHRNDA